MRDTLLSSSLGLACFLAACPAFAQDEEPSEAEPGAATPPPVVRVATPAQPPSAADPKAETADDKPKDRDVYVAISPLHLLFPIVHLTAEVRLHRRIGVAAIGGIGSIDPDLFSGSTRLANRSRFTIWEVGGQFVSYPVGHFDHGMQLGAQVLYTGVAGSVSDGTATAVGGGQGLGVGPFVGYKYTTRIGFAVNVQGGVQVVAARANASGSDGSSAEASQTAVGPLLNLNVGWAF